MFYIIILFSWVGGGCSNTTGGIVLKNKLMGTELVHMQPCDFLSPETLPVLLECVC